MKLFSRKTQLFITFLFVADVVLSFEDLKKGVNTLKETIYYAGKKTSNDRVIYEKDIITPQSSLTGSPTTFVVYPAGNAKGEKVTYILITDHTNTTLQASITEGGVGHDNVTIRIQGYQYSALKLSVKLYNSGE